MMAGASIEANGTNVFLNPAVVDYGVFCMMGAFGGATVELLVKGPTYQKIDNLQNEIVSQKNVLVGMQDAANSVSPSAPNFVRQQLQATVTEQSDQIHRMQAEVPSSAHLAHDILGGAIIGAALLAAITHGSRRRRIQKREEARNIHVELFDVSYSSSEKS